MELRNPRTGVVWTVNEPDTIARCLGDGFTVVEPEPEAGAVVAPVAEAGAPEAEPPADQLLADRARAEAERALRERNAAARAWVKSGGTPVKRASTRNGRTR